jgi:hypothetical protein
VSPRHKSSQIYHSVMVNFLRKSEVKRKLPRKQKSKQYIVLKTFQTNTRVTIEKLVKMFKLVIENLN